MRIWQAGKKREALINYGNPLANMKPYEYLMINGEILEPAAVETTGLYSGRALLADGRVIEYEW